MTFAKNKKQNKKKDDIQRTSSLREKEKEIKLAPNDHVSIDMGNDIFPDLPIGTWSGPPITPRSGASSIQSNTDSIRTVIRAPVHHDLWSRVLRA